METSDLFVWEPSSDRTCLQEVSHVKTLVTPESVRGSTANARGCGQSTPELLASFDPATSSWRTSQLCLGGDLAEFSETWPRSGLMRNGIAYRLPPLAPLTGGIESGLLPTPTDASKGGGSSRSGARINETPTLQGMARKGMWPTPSASDWKNRGGFGAAAVQRRAAIGKQIMLSMVAGGALNPTWVEWLMGFPLAWTALDASATPSSRKSRKSSDGQS